MKEKLCAFFIIILFAGFAAFSFLTTNRKTVVNVITPVMFQIDLNNNSIVDDNETICIPEIKSYTSNMSYFHEEIKDMPFEESVAVGYLADEFAHSTLESKDVKLKFTNKLYPQCRVAEVFVDNRSYSDILKNSGFAIINGKPYNPSAFNQIKQKAKNLKLVIYNHKSTKYHKLNCKFGKIAHDAVILTTKDLPPGAKPCRYCHIKPQKAGKNLYKKISPAPDIITSGNIKVILTDFTKIQKPDKNCTNEVCREFVNLTDNADESIDIALYGWTNIPKVRNSIEKAISRGVKIRVIYDTKTSSKNYYPDTDEFVKIFKYKRSDRIEGSSKLTNALMHNKFAIFDRKKVFTGSMNFSHTGFSGFNQNNVLIINSPAAAKIYTDEFEQMYNGKFHSLKAKTLNNSLLLSDGSKVSILFSPQDKGISYRVVPLVNSAKHNIYVPAFLITHKSFTNSLIAAYKRGVNVKIIIDATNTGTRNSTLIPLRTAGVPVKVENYAGKMHSKTIIIDNKYIVTGSTNFSNSGENKNDENMLIIENPKIAKFYAEFFEYLWAKIPDKYLKFNPPAESKYSLGSCTDGIDNDFDGKIDAADEGCH